VLAVTAGLRIGELLALRWQDVDLEPGRATLRVQRTKSTTKGGPVFTTPKNGKGRSIMLTRHAIEALKVHRVAQNAERLKAGTLSGRITGSSSVPTEGGPWTPTT
jgi:integrase